MKEPYQLTNYLVILLIVVMSCQSDKKETSESGEGWRRNEEIER